MAISVINQEEIKSRLHLGNTHYCLVQNLLLSKNVRIKIYETIILPFVLYQCKMWSLTSKYEHKLRVCENRVVRRRIFGPKREQEAGEKCTMSFIVCTLHRILQW
jgi:hypothetical protein